MNKRHYEHTLPNIRGSLSNTYERTPEEFLDGVLELVKGITGEIRRIQRPEE